MTSYSIWWYVGGALVGAIFFFMLGHALNQRASFKERWFFQQQTRDGFCYPRMCRDV